MDYSRVTIMFCLPRSRSQWFAWFMRQASNMECWHDPLREMMHPGQLVDKVAKWLVDNDGNDKRLFIADTAASMFYNLIDTDMPNVQRFFVLRDETEVAESMRRQTGYEIQDLIHRQAEYLKTVADHGQSEWPVLYYNHLTYGNLALLWEYVTDRQRITFRQLQDYRSKVVDTPVRQQTHFPERLRSLLGYREFA